MVTVFQTHSLSTAESVRLALLAEIADPVSQRLLRPVFVAGGAILFVGALVFLFGGYRADKHPRDGMFGSRR